MRTVACLLLASVASISIAPAAQPNIGERPPDFKLSTPEGRVVQLSKVMTEGTMVLVVLRGYPGYQCPYCNRQAQDFIANAQRFAELGAHVILVYPGPPQDLRGRAAEFLVGKQLPADFDLVLDPGYSFTNAYGLRWNAQNETAYPSTFLISRDGVIFFSKIVKEHGGRTTASEVIEAMPKSGK
jgi:peroxiredoxin